MTYGLRSMTAAMLCALLAGPIATASAMPIGNGLVAKNAIPTDVESVRWRGGWGGRGWVTDEGGVTGNATAGGWPGGGGAGALYPWIPTEYTSAPGPGQIRISY